jgi:hypothetical protein
MTVLSAHTTQPLVLQLLALAVHRGAHTDGGWYVPVSVSALWLEVRLPTVAHTLPDGGLGGLGGGGG